MKGLKLEQAFSVQLQKEQALQPQQQSKTEYLALIPSPSRALEQSLVTKIR